MEAVSSLLGNGKVTKKLSVKIEKSLEKRFSFSEVVVTCFTINIMMLSVNFKEIHVMVM
jgi:hypothetical protein